MSEYASIPMVARALYQQGIDISEQTVRRYTRNYGCFFQQVDKDGVKTVPLADSVKLVERIAQLTRAGQRKGKVIDALKAEGWEVYEEIPAPGVADSAGDSDLARVADALERLAQVGEFIAENLVRK